MRKEVDAKCPKCSSEFVILEAIVKDDELGCPYCKTDLFIANISPLVIKKAS